MVVGGRGAEDRGQRSARGEMLLLIAGCCVLRFACFHNISSSTLYGVTNPVTEVTNLVTLEESLTLGEAGG